MLKSVWIKSEFEKWQGLRKLGVDERNTEDKILLPLLRKLGWDTTDIREVRAQFDVNGEKADYVLFGTDGQPLVLVEMKSVSTDLNRLIEDGYLDERKYLRQAQKIGVLMCLISNGLTYRVYVNDNQHNRFLRCRTVEADLGNCVATDSDVAAFIRTLKFFSKSGVAEGDSHKRILSIAKDEQALNDLKELLLDPDDDLVSVLTRKLGVRPGFIRSHLPSLVNEGETWGLARDEIESEQGNLGNVFIGPYARLARDMTGNAEGNKKWRRKASKHFDLWRSFKDKRFLTKDEIIYHIKDVVKPKGRGQFFSTYAGSKTKTPILVKSRQGYSVAPELEEIFPLFLQRLEDEMK